MCRQEEQDKRKRGNRAVPKAMWLYNARDVFLIRGVCFMCETQIFLSEAHMSVVSYVKRQSVPHACRTLTEAMETDKVMQRGVLGPTSVTVSPRLEVGHYKRQEKGG